MMNTLGIGISDEVFNRYLRARKWDKQAALKQLKEADQYAPA
jgi:hypothetical protein